MVSKDLISKGEDFVRKILLSIERCNLEDFEELLGTFKRLPYPKPDITQIFSYLDSDGQTVFHLLCNKIKAENKSRKKRSTYALMFEQLLAILGKDQTHVLDHCNSDGENVLHLTIKNDFEGLFDLLLKKNVNIAISNKLNESPLSMAVKLDRFNFYKKLINKHIDLNLASNAGGIGYSFEEIRSVNERFKAKLQRKQNTVGVLNSLLGIACPVGSILAFYGLPLLAIIFSSLIPVAGPFIGLAGAIIMGGLIFWSVQSKSALKYGKHAQKLADLAAKNAQIDYLQAELRLIEKKLQQPELRTKGDEKEINTLFARQKTILAQLDVIFRDVKEVRHRSEASPRDWAKRGDKVRSHIQAGATFLCAFSGTLGILGGLSYFLPASIVLATVAAGIPVVGWCALGIALIVGAGIALWAYKNKFRPTRDEYGKARMELHLQKESLYNKKIAMKENSLAMKFTNTSFTRLFTGKLKRASFEFRPVVSEDKEKSAAQVSAPTQMEFIKSLGEKDSSSGAYSNQESMTPSIGSRC